MRAKLMPNQLIRGTKQFNSMKEKIKEICIYILALLDRKCSWICLVIAYLALVWMDEGNLISLIKPFTQSDQIVFSIPLGAVTYLECCFSWEHSDPSLQGRTLPIGLLPDSEASPLSVGSLVSKLALELTPLGEGAVAEERLTLMEQRHYSQKVYFLRNPWWRSSGTVRI